MKNLNAFFIVIVEAFEKFTCFDSRRILKWHNTVKERKSYDPDNSVTGEYKKYRKYLGYEENAQKEKIF